MIEFDNNSLKHLSTLLAESDDILITAHMSPDGDAMGSSLALYSVLRKMGKSVSVVVPDDITRQLAFLPGFKDVVVYCRKKALATELFAKAQLVMCLDYNEFKRVDQMAPLLTSSAAPKVMIDHHIDPTDLCDVLISCPEASSTCLLLFYVLEAIGLDDKIDKDAATCILAGMMTDTGNFSYNANDPMIYTAISKLLIKGADKNDLNKRLFDTYSESFLKINAYAIYKKMQVFKEFGAALITLTRDELNMHHYSRGDTEGLVNKPLAIPGVHYSVFLREEDRYIKVSMRSVGDFPCDQICSKYFNGGGHLNAAGGEFFGSMAQAVEVFKSILPINKKLYLK